VINRRLRYLGWLAIPCECPDHRRPLGTWPLPSLRRTVAWALFALTDTPLPRSYLNAAWER
jgi:hypothetical protein